MSFNIWHFLMLVGICAVITAFGSNFTTPRPSKVDISGDFYVIGSNALTLDQRGTLRTFLNTHDTAPIVWTLESVRADDFVPVIYLAMNFVNATYRDRYQAMNEYIEVKYTEWGLHDRIPTINYNQYLTCHMGLDRVFDRNIVLNIGNQTSDCHMIIVRSDSFAIINRTLPYYTEKYAPGTEIVADRFWFLPSGRLD